VRAPLAEPPVIPTPSSFLPLCCRLPNHRCCCAQPDLAYASALCHYRCRALGPASRILDDLVRRARGAHPALFAPPALAAAAGDDPFGSSIDDPAAARRQQALRASFAVEALNLAAAIAYEAGDEEGAR
jgi:hypothetical protein